MSNKVDEVSFFKGLQPGVATMCQTLLDPVSLKMVKFLQQIMPLTKIYNVKMIYCAEVLKYRVSVS